MALDLSGVYVVAYLKYRKTLYHLHNYMSKLDKECTRTKKAYKDPDDQGTLLHLEDQKNELTLRIELIKSSYLESKADILMVSLTKEDDALMYKTHNFDDEKGCMRFLNSDGIFKLKSKIREEEKAIRDVYSFWFVIFMGVISTVIALVSLLKK